MSSGEVTWNDQPSLKDADQLTRHVLSQKNTSVYQVIRFRPIDAYQHPNLDLGGNLVRERLAVDLLDGDECRVESKDGDLLLLLGAIAGKESRLALDD